MQDVKYLAERITREEERAQLRKERASKTINPKMIAKLLPADIQVRPLELLHLTCNVRLCVARLIRLICACVSRSRAILLEVEGSPQLQYI